MKHKLSVGFVLVCTLVAVAQEKKEVTTVTTTTTTVAPACPVDLLGLETFNFLDATPLLEGTVDLRLATRWANTSNSWNMTPEIVWGASESYELSVATPVWMANSWDIPGQPDGNYDTYLGGLWRLSDFAADWGQFALGWRLRLPTGEHSNGVDGQLRLVLTNEYDSGIRSHLNFWGTTVNTDNVEEARHFQYGAVAGLDGPLGDDGSLRWIFDYMYEISHEYGGGRRNSVEGGLQWQIDECNKLGFSVQAGLDHSEDETPELGAALTYSLTIGG
jgi:hypothetical protein